MKKFILFSACALVAFSMGLVSCSDDDDEGGSSGKGKSGGSSYNAPKSNIITTDSGEKLLLTNVQNNYETNRTSSTSVYVNIGYDEEGLLTSYRRDHSYNISYNPFLLNYTSNEVYGYGGLQEYYEISYDFTINSNGLPSMLVYNLLYKDDGDTDTFTSTYTFEYDSDEHITQIVADYGKDGSCTGIFTFTWEDGNLTKYAEEYTNEKAEGYNVSDFDVTFRYSSSSSAKNKYQQFPVVFDTYIENSFSGHVPCDGGLRGLGFLGLLGKGPAYLPLGYTTSTGNTAGSSYYTYDEKYSFTYNNDGTIANEKHEKGSASSLATRTYTYKYETLE